MVFEALIGISLVWNTQVALVERALAYDGVALKAGHSGRPITPPLFPPIRREPSVAEEDHRTDVHLSGRIVGFDRRTGCIRFYFGHDGYSHEYNAERRGRPRPTLSPQEVHRLAKFYLKEADPRVQDCLIREVEVDPYDPIGTVVATVAPTHHGVPYAEGSVAILKMDPLYGRLLVLLYAPMYDPPASVVPQIGLEAAREIALEELARFHGATQVREIERLELCIVRPVAETRGQEEWFTPSQLALGAAYRGILVYGATYGRLDRLMEDGIPFHQYRTLVDAQSGRVLALWHMRPLLGGGGPAKPAPFAWDLGPSPILLTAGGWSRTVYGSVDLVSPPPSFHADRKIGLTVSRLSLRAEYDASQGLLRTKVGKGYRYGRMSGQMERALRNARLGGKRPPTSPNRMAASS